MHSWALSTAYEPITEAKLDLNDPLILVWKAAIRDLILAITSISFIISVLGISARSMKSNIMAGDNKIDV